MELHNIYEYIIFLVGNEYFCPAIDVVNSYFYKAPLAWFRAPIPTSNLTAAKHISMDEYFRGEFITSVWLIKFSNYDIYSWKKLPIAITICDRLF